MRFHPRSHLETTVGYGDQIPFLLPLAPAKLCSKALWSSMYVLRYRVMTYPSVDKRSCSTCPPWDRRGQAVTSEVRCSRLQGGAVGRWVTVLAALWMRYLL